MELTIKAALSAKNLWTNYIHAIMELVKQKLAPYNLPLHFQVDLHSTDCKYITSRFETFEDDHDFISISQNHGDKELYRELWISFKPDEFDDSKPGLWITLNKGIPWDDEFYKETGNVPYKAEILIDEEFYRQLANWFNHKPVDTDVFINERNRVSGPRF